MMMKYCPVSYTHLDVYKRQDHFYLAEDRGNYSKAFREYRSELIKKNFGIIVIIIILIPVILFISKKIRLKLKEKKIGKGEK